MVSKKITISFALIVITGLILIGFSILYNKPLETVSASINMDTENIFANFNGKIKEFNYKDYDNVKIGDIIATIEVVQTEEFCKNKTVAENKQKQAVAEYENAAIMYKDGVITQEEYDASLDKLRKTQSQKVCTGEATHTENIYAVKAGKIYYANYNVGDTTQSEDVIATIATGQPQIYAYFSPKQAKNIKSGMVGEISIIKYPEKQFTGIVKSVSTGDIMGNLVILDINEEVDDLNLRNGDAAVVRISK